MPFGTGRAAPSECFRESLIGLDELAVVEYGLLRESSVLGAFTSGLRVGIVGKLVVDGLGWPVMVSRISFNFPMGVSNDATDMVQGRASARQIIGHVRAW